MSNIKKDAVVKCRFENFGGIISGDNPPFLAFVDRDYMRHLGLGEAMSTYGCEAGNVLLGIRSNGRVAGCSFLKSSGFSVFDPLTNPDCPKVVEFSEESD